MTTVAIRTNGNRLTASVQELASDYKWRRLERHMAWDMFVIDRNLKPDMNAKDFFIIFDAAYPCPLYTVQTVDFSPTHVDTLVDMPCQIMRQGDIYHVVWANGMTGSMPQHLLGDRFVPIAEVTDGPA